MITILHENEGYRIKLSASRGRFFARDADEIGIAVKHYYGQGCFGEKKNENCPICRNLMQREKKGRKS